LSDDDLNKWRDEYKELDAPHNYRALFTVEVTDLFFQHINDQDRDVLPEHVIEFLGSLEDHYKISNLNLQNLPEKALPLFPICVYYLHDSTKLQFTFSLPSNIELMIHAWEKMIDLINKVRNADPQTLDWIDSIV